MRVLVIGAHTDDAILQAGGTLAKYAEAGHSITIIVLSPGVKKDDELPYEEAASIRRREAEASAAVIGATLIWMGCEEFNLPRTYEEKLPLVDAIRRANPDVILGHYPDDYSIDHRVAAELTDECYMMAFQKGIKTDAPPCAPTAMIYHMDTVGGVGFIPDTYVDITEHYDIKRRMMELHESEVKPYLGHPVFDTLEWMEVHARYRGIQRAVRYAEAFCWSRRWASVEEKRLLP